MSDIPDALSQAIWIADGNIARFQDQMKTVEDYSARKMLEYLLSVERDKLALLNLEAKALKNATHPSPKCARR